MVIPAGQARACTTFILRQLRFPRWQARQARREATPRLGVTPTDRSNTAAQLLLWRGRADHHDAQPRCWLACKNTCAWVPCADGRRPGAVRHPGAAAVHATRLPDRGAWRRRGEVSSCWLGLTACGAAPQRSAPSPAMRRRYARRSRPTFSAASFQRSGCAGVAPTRTRV
jgi:hypothetical protein